jgi:hypothetical protein
MCEVWGYHHEIGSAYKNDMYKIEDDVFVSGIAKSGELEAPTTPEAMQVFKRLKLLDAIKKIQPKDSVVKFISDAFAKNNREKLVVKFAVPTELPLSRGLHTMTTLRLFPHNGMIAVCPGRRRGRGVLLSELPLRTVTSIKIKKRIETDRLAQLKKMRRFMHSNAWKAMQAEIDTDPVKFAECNYNSFGLVDIKKHLYDHEYAALKNAMDKGEEWHWSRQANPRAFGKTARDLSIDVVKDKGIPGSVRAWYTAEYPGCGNGSYYVLISPKYAAMREDD